jgi:hypothetical protein
MLSLIVNASLLVNLQTCWNKQEEFRDSGDMQADMQADMLEQAGRV